MPEKTPQDERHEPDEEIRAVADELTGLLGRLLAHAVKIDTKDEPTDRLLAAAVLVRRAWHALAETEAARAEQREDHSAKSQTQTDPEPTPPDPEPPLRDPRHGGHPVPVVCVHVQR